MEVLELARTGAVAAHVETFPFDDVEDDCAALRERRIRVRVVLAP
jgi:D-arabinose 1-dehydrogenase-like Zn-dependent alcohol dehydrogenase